MVKISILASFSSLYAICTGVFLALPGIPTAFGVISILISLSYCYAVCMLGKQAIWLSMALAVALTLAYAGASESANFSIINFAVASGICINFAFFGFLIQSLPPALSQWQVWAITAGLFSSSLALGWFVSLRFN